MADDDSGTLGDFNPEGDESEDMSHEEVDEEVVKAIDNMDEKLGQEGDEYEHGEKKPIAPGVKIRAKIKRGEDTRDQDEVVIEGRGVTADEAADQFERSLERAEEGDWSGRLRAMQAEGENDGD